MRMWNVAEIRLLLSVDRTMNVKKLFQNLSIGSGYEPITFHWGQQFQQNND